MRMLVTSAQRRRGPIATACVLAILAGSTGCTSNDYAAMEDTVRTWSAAVRAGDTGACRMERPGFQEDVSAAQDGGRSCADRVERRMFDAPSRDAELRVAAWDPSGEALVEAREPGGGRAIDFWLVLDDGTWLLAGYDGRLTSPEVTGSEHLAAIAPTRECWHPAFG